MAEQENVVFELQENLYREGCPVLLLGGALTKNTVRTLDEAGEETETVTAEARLRFQSLDSRPIASVYVDVHTFDKLNREIETVRDKRYLLPFLHRDEVFGADEPIAVRPDAASFSVAIRRVDFEGEEQWIGSGSILFESLPAPQKLEEKLTDETLLKQYRRDFAKQFAENSRGRAVCVPQRYKYLWQCACGELNHSDEEHCFACGAVYETQTALLEDEEQILKNHEAHEEALRQQAEQERLEAERRAAEEKAAAEERARIAAEEKAAAEARARKRKKKICIFLAISIPLALAIAVFIYALIHYILPMQKYHDAEALLANGEFDAAEAAFAELDTFQNSRDRIDEVTYRRAEKCLADGEYEQAIAYFEQSNGFDGAEEGIVAARYGIAVSVMEAGDWEEAVQLFEALPDYANYEDVPARIESCQNSLALAALEGGDLKKALSYREMLSEEHRDALESAVCDAGIALYEAGEDEKAAPYFAAVEREELLEKITAARYDRAVQRMQDKKYEEALALFAELGDYKDSAKRIQEIHYNSAKDAAAAEDWKTAVAEYQAAGDYKDAADQIITASYAYGVQLLNSGDVLESYNVLYPIRNYYDAFYLLVTNSQYYIYVYDPGVGPNPLGEQIDFIGQ